MGDGVSAEFSAYQEARMFAREIARRERLHEDVVFADAMHVAVAMALESEDRPYSKRNAAWMLGRICPEEVLEVLTFRWGNPEGYESLPLARTTERLNATQIEAASSLATSMTQDQLDAFFFSDQAGTA